MTIFTKKVLEHFQLYTVLVLLNACIKYTDATMFFNEVERIIIMQTANQQFSVFEIMLVFIQA